MGTLGERIRLVVVAVAYGVSLFLYLRAVPDGLTSPWFVFAAMICFLGLAFVAQPVVRIQVPGALRVVRRWEGEGRVYRALGVPAFGRLLRRPPLRFLNTHVYLGHGHHPAALSLQLQAAEASHLWAGALVVPYMAYACTEGAWITVSWFCVAQVLVNAYPIAHLRLVRYRLNRLVRKASTRDRRP